MKLSHELAQSIVDRTHNVVDYTINIMDSNAIIIASTDKKRIGEFHTGAKKVLDTNKHYILNKSEAAKYPNTLPGISLPIRFQNEILGVIGVGNSSKSAVTYGKFLQFSTELLLEQAFLKEELMVVEHAREEFIRRLLQDSWLNNETFFKQQITLHDFNINQSYLIVTVELDNENYTDNEFESNDSAISRYEKTITTLLKTLNYRLHYSDICNINILNKINFLIPYINSDIGKEDFINKFISDLDFVLSQTLNGIYRIGNGGIANDMTEIHKHYKHAISALQLSKIIGNNDSIVSFKDIYSEYILLSLSGNKRKKYYLEIIGPLLRETENQKKQWLETLDSFFNNNRSLIKTSKELFIHRNSLLFRLNRIHKITGFNPQNFKDANKLYMAIILMKLDTIDENTLELLQNP